jgi:hypothetical protein
MKSSALRNLGWRLRLVVLATFLSLPFGFALAQVASPDYTTDLPSIARVETEINGKDPTDTLARQVAVFTYLQTYIDRTKYARTVRGPYTAGEQKMRAAYSGAAAQISQDYAKSHTADEAKAFERLHGQYEMDETFNAAWQKSLIGPQATAAYNGAVNSLAAGQRAHIAQEQEQYQKNVAAQRTAVNGTSNDPTSVATRRCLELGGDSTACLGKGLTSGIIDLFTGGAGFGNLTGPGRAGVVLSGIYHTQGATTSINFTSNRAGIDRCGDLEEVASPYTIRKSPTGTQIILQSEPRPITLTMRPDGSLIGPGLVDVTGQIIIGYHTVTTTQMINGVRAAPNQCNGPCQTISRVPDYAPKTVRCSIASFAPPPPAPPASAAPADTGIFGALTSMMGTVSPSSEPGLRMVGEYASVSGLLLNFGGDAVTLDCGKAHVKAPYTVENTPTQFLIHVQNPGGPFALTFSTDNALRGTGSTTINGRLVSGMSGDNITFTPHSETCVIGAFAAKTSSSSSIAATPSTPVPAPSTPAASAPVTNASAAPVPSAASATASEMRLNITSTFPTAANPLAGKPVKLMTLSFDSAMRGAGAPIPAGTTPGQALQAWAYACSPPKDCSVPSQLMAKYYVGRGTFDDTGKVILRATVPPGTYYVFCSVAGTKGALVWDLPVTLKAGDNIINLTATNAELVPIAATH